MKNPHAQALGRMTSPEKAKASRINGLLGGRPRGQLAPRAECPKCHRNIALLKSGEFRKHNCKEEGE